MEHNEILNKIRCDEVRMRSKTYFKLKLFLLTTMAFLILIVSILICSFVFFSIRESGQALLLGFGSKGFYLFLVLFPWTILMLGIALLVVLECLLRQFRFGYRSPTVYLLGGIVVSVLIVSFVVDRTTAFHKTLLKRADKNALPVFGGMYEDVRRQPLSHKEVCRCEIVSLNENILTVRDDREVEGLLRTFVLSQNTATSSLKIGDTVLVMGEGEEGHMTMVGIEHFPQSE